jgi:hypothetical protein
MADPLDPLAGREDFTSDSETYISRAQLLKKAFGIDVTRCACGGTYRPKALVEAPDRIRAELQGLGLWRQPPTIAGARAQAQQEAFHRHSVCDGVDPPPPDCVA